MILPTTTLATLLAVILGLVCWGSWANFYKASGRWRFEFFYYDFTWGVILVALVAAFTLGSMNTQDLTFQDNFLLTGYRKMAWAWSAGVMLNLANLLLMSAMVIAGMSVAFPISLGLATILTVIWVFLLDIRGAALLPFGGSLLVAAGVVLCIVAYSWRLQEDRSAAQLAFIADPRTKAPPKVSSSMRGAILALFAGIFITLSRFMLTEATTGDNGVSAYGAVLLVAFGMLLSSLLFVPFFLNFPASGKPEQVRLYFKGTKKQHILGILAGMIWASGLLAFLVVEQAPPSALINPAVTYMLSEGVMVLAACWGILVWREFKGGSTRVQTMLFAMLVLLAAGIGVIGIARRSIH